MERINDELTVRPSMKPSRTGYTLVFTFIAICVFAYNNSTCLERQSAWILAPPALLLAIPIVQHVRRSRTELSIAADGKLRYKAGILNKVEKTVRASEIGNVMVEQTFGQRLLGTGKLIIETEEGRNLAINNIDNPESVAAAILGIAGNYAKKGRHR